MDHFRTKLFWKVDLKCEFITVCFVLCPIFQYGWLDTKTTRPVHHMWLHCKTVDILWMKVNFPKVPTVEKKHCHMQTCILATALFVFLHTCAVNNETKPEGWQICNIKVWKLRQITHYHACAKDLKCSHEVWTSYNDHSKTRYFVVFVSAS